MKKKLYSIICIILSLCAGLSGLSGCHRNIPIVWHYWSAFGSGSRPIGITVQFYTFETYKTLTPMFEKMETETWEIELAVSTQREDSDIYRLNHADAYEEIAISEITLKNLETAKFIYEISEGAFNPAIYPLVDIYLMSPRFMEMDFWGESYVFDNVLEENEEFFTEAYLQALNGQKRPPPQEWVDRIMSDGRMNFNNVIIDKANMKVWKTMKETQVDLGGIAKGYAADISFEIAKKYKMKSGIIDVSGNLYLMGNDISVRKDWDVFITNPIVNKTYDDELFVAHINGKDTSFVTSGVYERNYFYDGVFYHHIFDASTGGPADSHILSTTVVGKNSAYCDALATAVCVMGEGRAKRMFENLIAAGNDYKAAIFKDDKTYANIGDLEISGEPVVIDYTDGTQETVYFSLKEQNYTEIFP
jgi:thiamine biosynthesis lipoprotein